MAVRSYRDLTAWQRAMDLANSVYEATDHFPRSELYGLTSQVRRAAVSVPSNIAEGQRRQSTKEFLNHLSIAYGSLGEVETQLMIGERRGYLSGRATESLLDLADEVGRLVNGLRNSLRDKVQTDH